MSVKCYYYSTNTLYINELKDFVIKKSRHENAKCTINRLRSSEVMNDCMSAKLDIVTNSPIYQLSSI